MEFRPVHHHPGTVQIPVLLAWFLVLAVSAPGCDDDKSISRFEGQTVNEWISQSQQRNSARRVTAYHALRAFPDNKEAMALLERALSDDAVPFPERLVAAQSLYRATGDSGRVVPKAGEIIRAEADGTAGGPYSTKELEDLVFWLGANAKPLVPQIEYARLKLNADESCRSRDESAV